MSSHSVLKLAYCTWIWQGGQYQVIANSSAWLKAPPIPSLGLVVPHMEFVVASRIWLGIPSFTANPPSSVLAAH